MAISYTEHKKKGTLRVRIPPGFSESEQSAHTAPSRSQDSGSRGGPEHPRPTLGLKVKGQIWGGGQPGLG